MEMGGFHDPAREKHTGSGIHHLDGGYFEHGHVGVEPRVVPHHPRVDRNGPVPAPAALPPYGRVSVAGLRRRDGALQQADRCGPQMSAVAPRPPQGGRVINSTSVILKAFRLKALDAVRKISLHKPWIRRPLAA